MTTEERNKFIQEKAATSTSIIVHWRFIPTGHLYVDNKDTNTYVGELYYGNPNYEMGGAIKVRDWVFVLEKMTSEAMNRLAPNNDPNVWVIAGFHDHSHYTFTGITASSQSELNNMLVGYIVVNFWPILHPEVFTDYLKEQASKEKPEDKQVT